MKGLGIAFLLGAFFTALFALAFALEYRRFARYGIRIRAKTLRVCSQKTRCGRKYWMVVEYSAGGFLYTKNLPVTAAEAALHAEGAGDDAAQTDQKADGEPVELLYDARQPGKILSAAQFYRGSRGRAALLLAGALAAVGALVLILA